MFAYLAQPIDQNDSSVTGNLVYLVLRQLQAMRVSIFHPSRAYTVLLDDPDALEAVDQINGLALYNCDALVAILPAGVPTLGVPAEIEKALLMNKPTVVITNIDRSVQISSWERQGATVYRLDDPIQEGIWKGFRDALLSPPESEEAVALNTLLVKYEPGAIKLAKAHPTDAGFDLATLKDETLHNGQRLLLRTGVSGSVPDGWWGRITGRSSARTRWECEVHEGVIDAGYTGELMIGVTYRGASGHIDIPAGTRLAQYILHPVWDGDLVTVDSLPETTRGTNGWGSSGH